MIRALVLLPTALLLGIPILSPDWWLCNYGDAFFWISCVLIFVECGLFFPFLPGDTLLFAMGLFIVSAGTASHNEYCSTTGIDIVGGPPWVDLTLAMTLFVLAAIGGNFAGYEIGRKIGPPLYERDGRILKRKYFDSTRAFFDLHGNKALVIGRFVPFVRTYITVVAGVTRMDRRRFLLWSLVGAVLWVFSITLLGYFLGKRFPGLGENIDKAMLVILAFTVVPIGWEWLKNRRKHARQGSVD